jgi:hypothetical protein
MNKNDEATRRAAAYIDEVREITARLGYGTTTISAEVYDQAVQTAATPVAELMQRGDR